MEAQKQAVIEQVEAHRGQGRPVAEVLGKVGVARSSYYRWEERPGREKTPWSEFVRDHYSGAKTHRVRLRTKSAVSAPAHPRGVATAGSVYVGVWVIMGI